MASTRLDAIRNEKNHCGHMSFFALHRCVCVYAHLAVFVLAFAKFGLSFGSFEYLISLSFVA